MQTAGERRALLMIWDGLRPDMVSEEDTPVLHRLAMAGVRFADSHAIFPTVTRCNSASIATGALPVSHGIPGNTFYAPALDAAKALATSNVAHLRALAGVRAGRLLGRETLGDCIHHAGGRSVVISTGSTGSAFLQHPNVERCGDLLLNPGLWTGLDQETAEAQIGPMPAGTLPNTAQNSWFTRLIAEYVLPSVQPRLVTFWHTDPDRTQHDRGIGHPETRRALHDADQNLATLLTALDRLGMHDTTDVIVTSDHGFSTIVGQVDVAAALVRAGLKASKDSSDVVVTGDAIYVPSGDPDSIDDIVAVLQGTQGIGPIFVDSEPERADELGAIALSWTGVGGEIAPDILFSHDWRDDRNAHGFPGSAWSGPTTTAATHGSISPWDIRNTLIGAGPDFRRGLVNETPTGAIDIAPTLLHILGLPAPAGMDGRVLSEALSDAPPAAVPVERTLLRAARGGFRQEVQISRAGRSRYIDFGSVERA